MLDYLWLLPFVWLLFGMPWMQGRMKRRHERERRERKLEWELMELWLARGREGLEAKMLADLKAIRIMSILRDTDTVTSGDDLDDLIAYMRGEDPPGAEELPLRTSDPFDDWRFFGLLPPLRSRPRVKRRKK